MGGRGGYVNEVPSGIGQIQAPPSVHGFSGSLAVGKAEEIFLYPVVIAQAISSTHKPSHHNKVDAIRRVVPHK